MSAVAKKLTTVDGESTYVDSENIQHLRERDGILEYSLDGEVWLPITGSNTIVGPVYHRRPRKKPTITVSMKEQKVRVEGGSVDVWVSDVDVDIV